MGALVYRYADIRRVHLEITSACNASCPQCPRNLSGGRTHPALPVSELSLADTAAAFPPAFVEQLDDLYINGNYGDGMVARDTLEVFRRLRSLNPRMHLMLHSNGSGREEEWWAELARLQVEVRFGIDGLEDTNHLYRRGTSWARIMKSVRAFIGAGGQATWDFILFRHNEHQLEAVTALSKELGFAKLIVKRTTRFQRAGKLVARVPVLSKDGELEYYLEQPSAPEHQNPELVQMGELSRRGGYSDYLASTDIRCKATELSKIFVDAQGHVFPCCWVGGLYSAGVDRATHEIWRLLASVPGGLDALDVRRRPLEEIIEGRFFQELVPRGWEKKAPAEGRLTVCARFCGTQDWERATYSRSLL